MQRLVRVPEGELEVLDVGSGEPVVFVQTALTADELMPVADDPALRAYRRILYHRRGYAGSSPVDGAGSILRDARDWDALMAGLAVDRAHVVGASYSGAVALQLAVDAPDRVHTLVVLEPPPTHVPSAEEFRAANDRLLRQCEGAGPTAALDDFMVLIVGDGWRDTVEAQLPGSVAQMERDATTFFDGDIPALLNWSFSRELARLIRCPVLHIGGTESGPWFAEVRSLVLDWLPHAEDVLVEGADHSLPLTHPSPVARAIADFLTRHPL